MSRKAFHQLSCTHSLKCCPWEEGLSHSIHFSGEQPKPKWALAQLDLLTWPCYYVREQTPCRLNPLYQQGQRVQVQVAIGLQQAPGVKGSTHSDCFISAMPCRWSEVSEPELGGEGLGRRWQRRNRSWDRLHTGQSRDKWWTRHWTTKTLKCNVRSELLGMLAQAYNALGRGAGRFLWVWGQHALYS